MVATGKREREREIQKWGKGIRMILSLFTSYNKLLVDEGGIFIISV